MLLLNHFLANIKRYKSIGMFLLDQTIKAGDQQWIIRKFYIDIKWVREMTTSWFHFNRIWTLPCYILQGMAPDEYKCANELPFFYANGSAVFMLASLADGNSVKPTFGLISYFLTIVTPFFGTLYFFTKLVAVVFWVFDGCIVMLM